LVLSFAHLAQLVEHLPNQLLLSGGSFGDSLLALIACSEKLARALEAFPVLFGESKEQRCALISADCPTEAYLVDELRQ
jgi:hypothetical protein